MNDCIEILGDEIDELKKRILKAYKIGSPDLGAISVEGPLPPKMDTHNLDTYCPYFKVLIKNSVAIICPRKVWEDILNKQRKETKNSSNIKTKNVIKRNVLSAQTKANLKVAVTVRIIPRSQSALTDYYVAIIGNHGKMAYVRDTRDEKIVYKSISAAKRPLKNYIDIRKIEIVSQFDI